MCCLKNIFVYLDYFCVIEMYYTEYICVLLYGGASVKFSADSKILYTNGFMYLPQTLSRTKMSLLFSSNFNSRPKFHNLLKHEYLDYSEHLIWRGIRSGLSSSNQLPLAEIVEESLTQYKYKNIQS